MKTDKNLLRFLAGEAVAQSIVGGGISDSKVKIQNLEGGLAIELETPSLQADNYDIELKDQFLNIYTFFGSSLLPETEEDFSSKSVLLKTLALPPVVQTDHIDAVFEDGKLFISVPFKSKEEVVTRKIDIKEQ